MVNLFYNCHFLAPEMNKCTVVLSVAMGDMVEVLEWQLSQAMEAGGKYLLFIMSWSIFQSWHLLASYQQ